MNKYFRVTMALALTFSSTPVWATTVKQEADVKVQHRVIKTKNGGESPIPNEYGETPNGLIFDRYLLDVDGENYVIEAEARNLNRNNQSIQVLAGKPGKTTVEVGWDEMPHLFSNEARSPFSYVGNGTMALGGAWRNSDLVLKDWAQEGAIYNIAGGSAPATNATNKNEGRFNAGISTALSNSPYVPLGFDVNTANIELKVHPSENFLIEFGVWRQTRRGTKAQSVSFGFSNALELAAPIDWETNEAFLELARNEKDYQLAFNYRLSNFNNKIPSLFFDNPKRMTDQYAYNGYSQGDQSAHGQMANAPDNMSQSFKVEGGVNLPMSSRLSGEAGYQRWTALNSMLPYTVNTAMTNTATAQAADRPAFDASSLNNRPDANVKGLIEVYTYMGKVTSRPLHWLRGALSHEAYIMENKSTGYDMPGFALFDSGWHVENVTNPREQFRDDKTALALDYDITPWLSGGTDLKHIYKKQTREIPKLHEYEAEQGFTIRPSRELFVNASYLMAARRGNGQDLSAYPTITSAVTGVTYFTEHPGLRRIDVADRNRNQGRLQVQWTPGEASLSLSARVTNDVYRIGKGDATGGNPGNYPNLFGTEAEAVQALGMDFSVPVIGSVVVDGYYEWDHTKRYMRSSQTMCAGRTSGTTAGAGMPGEPSCASGTLAPTIITGDPRTQWQNRIRDVSHIAGLGVTVSPMAKLKTFFGYDIVSTKQNIDPMYAGSAASTATDPYNPFPTSRRLTQSLKARGEYQLLESLTLAANYMYEKFDATDFAYGEVPMRNGNDAIWLGANPIRNYYAHTFGAGLNYKF